MNDGKSMADVESGLLVPGGCKDWVVVNAHPREWPALRRFVLLRDYIWPGQLLVRPDMAERVRAELEKFRQKHFHKSLRAAAREYREREKTADGLDSGKYVERDGFVYAADELYEYEEKLKELDSIARDIEEQCYKRWTSLGKPWPWRMTIGRDGWTFTAFSYISAANGGWHREMAVLMPYPPKPAPLVELESPLRRWW